MRAAGTGSQLTGWPPATALPPTHPSVKQMKGSAKPHDLPTAQDGAHSRRWAGRMVAGPELPDHEGHAGPGGRTWSSLATPLLSILCGALGGPERSQTVVTRAALQLKSSPSELPPELVVGTLSQLSAGSPETHKSPTDQSLYCCLPADRGKKTLDVIIQSTNDRRLPWWSSG